MLLVVGVGVRSVEMRGRGWMGEGPRRRGVRGMESKGGGREVHFVGVWCRGRCGLVCTLAWMYMLVYGWVKRYIYLASRLAPKDNRIR